VLVLLLLFLFFALGSAKRSSVTFDEFAHVPAGVAYWKERAFYLYPQNPPLARLLSTLPLLGTAHLPPIAPVGRTDPEYRWEYAEDFMLANLVGRPDSAKSGPPGPEEAQGPGRPYYDRLIFMARVPVVVLGVLLGAGVFFWSKHLFGYWGGVVSLALYAFCPNMLAHASLATTDLTTALFSTLALFALFRFGKSPGVLNLTLAGCAFGLALLSKFTALVLLLPAGLLLFLPSAPSEDRRPPALRQRAGVFALFLVTIWVVFCAGYFFTDLFRAVGEIPLHSKPLTSLQRVLPSWFPLPLPADALTGIDAEWLRTEQKLGIYYLLGELSREGWWSYFPVALATKVPIPLLILWSLSLGACLRGFARLPDRRVVFTLLLPPLLFLCLFMTMTKTNYGVRYLLVCFPFLFILCGVLVGKARKRWMRVCLGLFVAWHVLTSVSISPHYLTYFNEIAGGPRGGMRVLADSNLDWGQQLKELKRYMEQQNIEEIALSYTGPVDPKVYGIRWKPLRLGVTHGPAAVSANHLVGFFPMGSAFSGGIQDLSPLRKLKPEAVLAHSLYVFRLE
jgi:hypothetical protein